MWRQRAPTLPAAAVLGLALGIAACAGPSAPPAGPSRPGELLVGTTPNYPPIIFKRWIPVRIEVSPAGRL